MKFALSTHLFHGERLTRAHLDAIAAQGFDDVEVFATRTHVDYHDARAVDDLAAAMSAAGLRVGSVHAPICASFSGGEWGRAFSSAAADPARRQEAVDETRKAMDAAVVLGAKIVVIHLGLPRGQTVPPDDNDTTAVRRSLEQLQEIAAKAGIRPALELIPNALSTPGALLDWLEGDTDLGQAGVCVDTGHAHLLGDVADAIESLSGYVITTHLHDNRRKTDDHLVPFDGTIDWPQTMMAFQKIGYADRLVFEVADHGDAAGVLARTAAARDRLRDLVDDEWPPRGMGG